MATQNPMPAQGPANKAACQQPTDEQLHLAFRHLWRQGWPATVEEAMQNKTLRICISGQARTMRRVATAAGSMHSLPTPPAPPTPGNRALTGPLKHGRSAYSIATGAQTELTCWRGSSPKQMMPGAPHIKRQYFDARKAAANDLDD